MAGSKVMVGSKIKTTHGEIGTIEEVPRAGSRGASYWVQIGGRRVFLQRGEFTLVPKGKIKNPAGWRQEESSAAVRKAIQTRHPADIQRARDLQVRNERAGKGKSGFSATRNPSVRDYASHFAGKAARAGARGVEIVSRKAREIASEAEAHAHHLESERKQASVTPMRALEVLAKEHGMKLVKNPGGGQKKNPEARKNGACACGCGGTCGKKNPKKNPVITWGHMNYGGIGHAPNDKNAYVVKFIQRSQAFPTDGYRVLHDNYYTKISRDASGRHVGANGEIVKDYYPSMEKGTFFYTMEDAMKAAELHASKHPIAAPVPKERKTRASKAR